MNPIHPTQKYDINEVGDLLSDVAAVLMTSGAHTMRIIQNTQRMASTFGYHMELSVFQMSIMMSLHNINEPNERITLVKKTNPLLINFTIVSDLSELSWRTYDEHLSIDDVKTAYQQIVENKRMSRWLVLVLASLANAAFCGIFHGDALSILMVFLATLAGFYVRQEMIHKQVNHLIVFACSAFVASLGAGLTYIFDIGQTHDVALASSVLYLIPGVPLINSILDIIQGHILTGISRLVNAISLIVCIALGLYCSMLILGLENL